MAFIYLVAPNSFKNKIFRMAGVRLRETLLMESSHAFSLRDRVVICRSSGQLQFGRIIGKPMRVTDPVAGTILGHDPSPRKKRYDKEALTMFAANMFAAGAPATTGRVPNNSLLSTAHKA